MDEPTTFDIDPDRVAPYSSGKVISQNKFSFKYGRIDYCAKLPTGTGIWPALWMMPNDEVYGTWAASGEIDVMEARGRLTNTVCGTIHYGGTWPANVYTGEDYYFPDGSTFDDGFHVYSCVWEEEAIKWYVDGTCYSVISYDEWYTNAAIDSPYAPFDQEFYIIMNLAAGGWFDGGLTPSAESIPSEMQVEYVRVYQAEGDTTCSYTNNGGGTIVTPDPTEASDEETKDVEETTEAEGNPVVTSGDYVYDSNAGTVTFTYKDSATASAIEYIAFYDNEADAKAAYNAATAALPGIDLLGHSGYFMESTDGVHTLTMSVSEGQWFVYGFNSIDNGGFKQEWKIGSAVKQNEETNKFPFTDVKKTSWYYDSVKGVYELGLMTGTTEITFAPTETMTRAMAATVLYRMAGSPETAYEELFLDVPDGKYYSESVTWAAQNGVVNGFGNGQFKPGTNVTREQLAKMLYNYAEMLGLDTSGRADLTTFKDGTQVSNYAKEPMRWAVANGILSGTATGKLKPRSNATRAEVAKMLLNFYKLTEE